MDQEQRKRATAVRFSIAELKSAPYVKEGGWASGYLQAGGQVSRIWIMGTVVQKAQDNLSLVVDDGSGSVALRVFEDHGLLFNMDVGGTILVIGKPREFGGERYVLPEIVRNVHTDWLKVHNKEISRRGKIAAPLESPIPIKKIVGVAQSDAQENNSGQNENSGESPIELVCAFIRQHDSGNGVDVEEVIKSSGVGDCEHLISQLLRSGGIFEIRPGRVKVLE